MPIDLKIIIKDDERKLTKDFNIYENIMLNEHDPILMKCVNEAIQEFKGSPEDIKIKTTMVWA